MVYTKCTDLHFSYLYIYDTGRTCILTHDSDKITVEQSYLANNESTPEEHSEPIAVQGGDNHVFRNNYFYNGAGTGSAIVYKKNYAWQISTNVYIYGNIVDGARSSASGAFCDSGDPEGGPTNNVRIYNNVIVNVSGWNAGSTWSRGGTIYIYNNIWCYNQNGPTGYPTRITFSGVTDHDYNYYYNNNTDDNTLAADEANGMTGSGHPFIDWQNGNFSLVQEIPGLHITYLWAGADSLDGTGNIRGADGLWDRGTIEYSKTNIEYRTPNDEYRMPSHPTLVNDLQLTISDVRIFNLEGKGVNPGTLKRTGIYLIKNNEDTRFYKITIIK
jgi:hypothetical protein